MEGEGDAWGIGEKGSLGILSVNPKALSARKGDEGCADLATRVFEEKYFGIL